jgi:hypothetical protein
MTDTHTEVLSAFYDGAAVDPNLLEAALEDPRARAALVDFARFRAAVTTSDPLPNALVALRPAVRGRPQLWAALAGAAAMLALVALTVALLPDGWFRGSHDAGPPSPTRVVRYQPGVDWAPETR